ncbi:MAG TPA: ABC transporter ATP-binding protein [Clostridiales bacterium]|nr:ABC transporter ATP-binding protein [Clostridiales bacterium]
MKTMDIRLKQVSKSFGKERVLNNINLTFPKGEILCLIGPSGAGKTTLLRIITGALKADEGEVRLDDILLPDPAVRRRIAFMPQNDAVYLDLSGLENLLFYGRMYRIREKELKERIHDVLAVTGLTKDAKKLAARYSGGMKKRLSLAITLLNDADTLILDEPTAGIDPLLRKTIWEEFHRLNAAGKTLIVSTHVMDEIRLCDKAALLYRGGIVAYDSVPALLAQTTDGDIEEIFLKSQKSETEAV